MIAKQWIFAFILSFSTVLKLFSQDYGAQWVLGSVPSSILDFRSDTLMSYFLSDSTFSYLTSANICDKEGEFLFFTNGISVRDKNGILLPNGDSLGYDPALHSSFNSLYNSVYNTGAPNDQGAMILPKPGSNRFYYIFHFMPIDTSFLSNHGVYTEPTHLYYSIVDMNDNFGQGAVIGKNFPLPLGLQCASRMTAVRHANGRDWWIIRHGFRDSTYYKFLFTPDDIYGPFIQKIGPAHQVGGSAYDFFGASVFNLDGNKFATSNQLGPVVVMDFDRCTGEFSNPVAIQNIVPDTTVGGAMGLAFSPNSRFLYASNKVALNQYDLLSNNINDSVRLFTETDDNGYAIHDVQLAPNGKIYVSTWHGGFYALHVINNPDELGLACNFEYAGQPCISGNTNALPNMPNYKLGALIGSGCDTIQTSVHELTLQQQIQISPNPAVNILIINTSILNTLLNLQLINTLGQRVLSKNFIGHADIGISNLPSGIYIAKISNEEKLLVTKNVVIN